MSERTTNLDLIIPEAPGANPNEVFDWDNFIRQNFLKIDAMKVLGDTRLFNAMAYVKSNGYFDWNALKADANAGGDLAVGLAIYFPPGIYRIDNANAPTVGMVIGEAESVAALFLLGAKGAVIDASHGTGDQIVDMLRISNVTDVSIQGLTFKGRAATVATAYTTAIRLKNTKNVHIANVKIQNIGYGIVVEPSSGVPSERVWVVNSSIENWNKIGVDVTSSLDVIIAGNILKRETTFMEPGDLSLGHGIRITPGTGGGDLQTFNVVNNIIKGSRRNGIELCAGTAPHVINVINNTIEKPGNFAVPGDQLVKTTRGSGIYSVATGRVRIDQNTIREPLSHGILLSNASKLKITNNIIQLGEERGGGLDGLSWHGIAVTSSPRCEIKNNEIRLGASYNSTFQGERRLGIGVFSSDYCLIRDNHINGGWECIYVWGSDRPVIMGNFARNLAWSGYTIEVEGESGATSEEPIIVGNHAFNGSGPGIRVYGGSAYTDSPIIIGNNSDVHFSGATPYSENYHDRVFGNKNDKGEPLLSTPVFGISGMGYINRGRRPLIDFCPPGALVPALAASIGLDDVGWPAGIFPNTGSGEFSLVVYHHSYDTTQEDGVNVEVWLSGQDDVSGTAVFELCYRFLGLHSDGLPKPSSYELLERTLYFTQQRLRYLRFYIPHEEVHTGNSALVLKIRRHPGDPNDNFNGTIYLHGVRVYRIGTYPSNGYGFGY